MVRSIHVPGSVVARIARALAYLMPPASIVISAVALGYRWVGNRASMEDVAVRLAPVAAAAKAAQAEAHHCASVLKEHKPQIDRAWGEVVSLHAELEVYRRHGIAVSRDAHRRGELIEDATHFFRAEYERLLEAHPNNPSEAARRAMFARWRESK